MSLQGTLASLVSRHPSVSLRSSIPSLFLLPSGLRAPSSLPRHHRYSDPPPAHFIIVTLDCTPQLRPSSSIPIPIHGSPVFHGTAHPRLRYFPLKTLQSSYRYQPRFDVDTVSAKASASPLQHPCSFHRRFRISTNMHASTAAERKHLHRYWLRHRHEQLH